MHRKSTKGIPESSAPVVLFAVALVTLFASAAEAQPMDPPRAFVTESGTVIFHSRVPLHNFTGTSSLLNGLISLADSTLDFYVDLSTLETGNRRRDRDMRKTLRVEEHPFAEFTGRLLPGSDEPNEPTNSVVAVGTFSINGVSRPLRVEGTLIDSGAGTLELSAAWELSLEDFEIRPPRLLIVKVNDTQAIELTATLRPQQ